jgi:hypothetical protein
MIKLIKKNDAQSKAVKFMKRFFLICAYSVLILYYLWCIPAVYFLNLPWKGLRIFLCCGFAAGIPVLLIVFCKNKKSVLYAAAVCLGVGIWFALIPPSHDRNWKTEVAKLPSVQFNGNKVTVKNVRSFIYRSVTDYTPRYYTRTYDLNLLESVDYILSYWDGNTKVAHSILSFGFKDGKSLCVSVETRLEKEEPQTAIRGLYKQYELIYIRKEKVFLYPLKIRNEENKRKLFVQILKKVMKIKNQPQFYGTIKYNCLTSLLHDVKRATGRDIVLDYRMMFNGFSDEMGYERNWFETQGLSFGEFKKVHNINQYVEDDPDARTNYSKKIRAFEKH